MSELILHTGRKGAFLFHIELELQCLTNEEVRTRYRNSQSELYDLKEDLNKIKSQWLINLLIRLKLIKV